MDKNPNVAENSLEMVILAQSTNIEDLGNLVKKNSQPVALNSSKDTDNGRLSYPITGPSSLEQSSKIGRLSSPQCYCCVTW